MMKILDSAPKFSELECHMGRGELRGRGWPRRPGLSSLLGTTLNLPILYRRSVDDGAEGVLKNGAPKTSFRESKFDIRRELDELSQRLALRHGLPRGKHIEILQGSLDYYTQTQIQTPFSAGLGLSVFLPLHINVFLNFKT